MKKTIHLGLIGVGGIGASHLGAIGALASEGLAQLIAVADPTVERLANEKAGLEARGVRWHLDYRDMLREETGLDAVTIATPIPFHFEMARACIERGVFVNLEKPPVPLIQQLESLIAADQQHRVNVGFQMIVSQAVQKLKNLIVNGSLGKIREIRVGGCWPRLDSYYNRAAWAGKMFLRGEPVFDGPATNALAHLIHNIMFLASSEPDEFDVPIEVRGELYRARRIESYDTACLRGRFGSGVCFSAAFTHATEETMAWRIEVRGDKDAARISDDGGTFESSFGKITNPEPTPDLFIKTYRQFIDFIQGNRPRVATRLRDTRGYLLATNGALVSSDGIHDIGEEWVRRYKHGEDSGFDVRSLRAAVDATLASGQLFSELGVPWAVKTPLVPLQDFTTVDFSRWIP